jgi:hypothetical protein
MTTAQYCINHKQVCIMTMQPHNIKWQVTGYVWISYAYFKVLGKEGPGGGLCMLKPFLSELENNMIKIVRRCTHILAL